MTFLDWGYLWWDILFTITVKTTKKTFVYICEDAPSSPRDNDIDICKPCQDQQYIEPIRAGPGGPSDAIWCRFVSNSWSKYAGIVLNPYRIPCTNTHTHTKKTPPFSAFLHSKTRRVFCISLWQRQRKVTLRQRKRACESKATPPWHGLRPLSSRYTPDPLGVESKMVAMRPNCSPSCFKVSDSYYNRNKRTCVSWASRCWLNWEPLWQGRHDVL